MFKEAYLEAMQRNQLHRFRLLSAVEGTSLLLLMFVATPLKHLAGFPAMAATVGPIHGVLVLTYIWSVFYIIGLMGWPKRRALSLIIPAFFPFGTFLIWRITRMSERS